MNSKIPLSFEEYMATRTGQPVNDMIPEPQPARNKISLEELRAEGADRIAARKQRSRIDEGRAVIAARAAIAAAKPAAAVRIKCMQLRQEGDAVVSARLKTSVLLEERLNAIRFKEDQEEQVLSAPTGPPPAGFTWGGVF